MLAAIWMSFQVVMFVWLAAAAAFLMVGSTYIVITMIVPGHQWLEH